MSGNALALFMMYISMILRNPKSPFEGRLHLEEDTIVFLGFVVFSPKQDEKRRRKNCLDKTDICFPIMKILLNYLTILMNGCDNFLCRQRGVDLLEGHAMPD